MKEFKCYWCGQKAINKEHVPPKSLFPKGKREQLITVRSCEIHNNHFSKLDERFKILFQLAKNSNEVAKNEFTRKTLKALKRKESKRFFDDLKDRVQSKRMAGKDEVAIALSGTEHYDFLEKIVRGLYYVHMESPAKNGVVMTFCKQISYESLPYSEAIGDLIPLLSSDKMIEGNCSNSDIFYYKYFGKVNTPFLVKFIIYENIECVGVITFED